MSFVLQLTFYPRDIKPQGHMSVWGLSAPFVRDDIDKMKYNNNLKNQNKNSLKKSLKRIFLIQTSSKTTPPLQRREVKKKKKSLQSAPVNKSLRWTWQLRQRRKRVQMWQPAVRSSFSKSFIQPPTYWPTEGLFATGWRESRRFRSQIHPRIYRCLQRRALHPRMGFSKWCFGAQSNCCS